MASVAATGVDFQRDIAPIFAEHCLECHGPDKAKGGLVLTSRDEATRKLESGAHAVVPGKPGASEMLARLTTTDEDDVMPPRKKKMRPSAADVSKLRKWIESGAEWAEHWAYLPLKRPPVPAGAANPVDGFIRAGLAARGIQPAPEADRHTLIKRLSYDLLGLPPTPEDADAFAADNAPDAVPRLVDRLLASPHFGERWGRHWLDKARYADSDGYEKDNPRPDAWRYRDWVIAAVNEDMPFDQFTIEQLAGDLLPNATPEQRLATAFHRQTLTNREGGVDQEQFRVEAVFDRTETTGAVWLGLTVGCARCHSHKYDLISQREYFSMFAFFNDADEATVKVGSSAEALAEYERRNAAHLAKLKSIEQRLAVERERIERDLPAWEKATHARLVAAEGKKSEVVGAEIIGVKSEKNVKFERRDDGSWLASGEQGKSDVYSVRVRLPAGTVTGLRLETMPEKSLPDGGPGRGPEGNFVVTELMIEAGGKPVLLHSPFADFAQKKWEPRGVLDGKITTGWSIGGQPGKPHHLGVQFAHPVEGGGEITVILEQQYAKGNHSIGCFRISALVGESEEAVASSEVRRLVGTGSEKWTEEDREKIVAWLMQFDPAASSIAIELDAAQEKGEKPPFMDARVLAQRSMPRDTRILHRGEFLSPTDPVQPGALSVLPPLKQRGKTPDRLDLARWLVSGDNPLTPRVAVNHIWKEMFGRGIVGTAGDFGVRGERPAHPELLDWLATELTGRGWSRKHIIRLIATSATYRQSSAMRPELSDVDPLNHLLARQSRVRVDGEIVRDLYLAAGGLLTPKIGGPSVFPPMPPEIAALSFANNFKWRTSSGADVNRRGMYTFFKRTAPHPDLMTFDCPDANVTCVERTVSNTPLQALASLNGQTFTAAARALAERVIAKSTDDTARVIAAFRTCLIRKPVAAETQRLLALVKDARTFYEAHPGEAKALAATGKDAVEVAAWMAATRIILNTDEFITRE